MVTLAKWITVKDMYKYSVENDIALLSINDKPYWQEYVLKHREYDKLFMRMYKSFRYYDQDPYSDDPDIIEFVTTDFCDHVKIFLAMNDKKYSELYRLNVLPNEDYKLFDNVNYIETKEGSITNVATNTSGDRQDTTDTNEGSRTDTSETKVSAFNSTDYENSNKTTDITGGQDTSSTFSKGSQTDTLDANESENYTLKRSGKVGGKTMQESLTMHKEFWDMYEFYNYIFTDIATHLLLI